MATDYSKYINSTGTHYISNSGSDENGAYHGGKAGDQSGREWQLKAWYNRPWTVVLRHPDINVGLKIAELGIDAALNDKVGYDQWERKSYWYQLQKVGYDPSKITVACEDDCTAGVSANVKAVGYLLDIEALKNISVDTYSGNMKGNFTKAGFQALTASKYITKHAYLLPGDILLYEGHHAATNVSYGSSVRPTEKKEEPAEQPKEDPKQDTGKKDQYVEVSRGNYYVRKGPSTSYASVTVAKKGTKLPYMGETKNGWYKVKYNNKNYWISNKCGSIIEE